MTLFNNLVCPLDQEELEQDGRSLRCPDGHVYDIAKSGYVNLLPVQKNILKTPVILRKWSHRESNSLIPMLIYLL